MKKVYLGIAIFVAIAVWRLFNPVESSINRGAALHNVATEVAHDEVCTESQHFNMPGMCNQLEKQRTQEYDQRLAPLTGK